MARLQTFAQNTDPLIKELDAGGPGPKADAEVGTISCRHTCTLCSSTSAR